MTTTARLATAFLAVTLTLGLAACGGSTTTGTAAPSASSSPAGSGAAAPAGAKVSANTASEEEIAVALEAAGVSNAEKWAEEVVEYRPYAADDPNLGHLRDELAKYNPGQETTDRIVATLAP